MSDIVERLREWSADIGGDAEIDQTADEIERLHTHNKQLLATYHDLSDTIPRRDEEIEQLKAALREVSQMTGYGITRTIDDAVQVARAALEGKP